MKGVRPLPPAERLEVDAALEIAFAPLRAERAVLSPRRVRAAVRWGRGAPREDRRWTSAISRLSELSVAAAMTLVVFIGSAGASRTTAPEVPATSDEARSAASFPVPRVTAPLEDEHYIRWLRLDRYVPLQDWLDPTVMRVGTAARPVARLDAPAPASAEPGRPF